MEQTLKQSPTDPKSYFPFTLANGLRVLLVQNTETEKSAAALAVNVGHFDDPKDRQGLAHFLEHMLFLGTHKYPDGSEYQQFISQYGGTNNAWTATEHTCFFFDIHHHFFAQALDRFSRFFSEPLLSKSFVDSERQNIDAEFKLKLKDDIRRLYDVHKETVNQDHPFSQFSVGNLETLSDRPQRCIRDELALFFQRFYRAPYMTLVLEGPQTIEQLKQLATTHFANISTTDTPKSTISTPLYLPQHLAMQLNVKPVRDERKLIISFAMPSLDHLYRYKPESILSYLLGHEGKGSILSNLKQKQWVMALTAGSGINGSNFKDFNIALSLTEMGEQHITDIIEIVFSYINLLKSSPLPDYYYQEKQAIAALSFHFHEKVSALDSVSQLVINMQHYPEEDYIFGDYVMAGMCQQYIDQLLTYMSPENMRVIHINQNNEFSTISHWYQVPYQLSYFSAQLLKQWQQAPLTKALHLPAPNPYITENPEVLALEHPISEASLQPHLLIDDNGFKLWFKQDVTFRVPKGHIYLGIDSPQTISSPENIAMTRLFVDLYSDVIVEENYDAELAGIHYHLYAHQGGLTLQLSGISAKQPILLEKLLQHLMVIRFNEARFNLLKQQLITYWHNTATSKSISQLFAKLSSALQPNNPTSATLATALSNITFSQFQTFTDSFLDKITINALIHGNWQQKDAKYIAQLIQQAFKDNFDQQHQVTSPVINIKQQGEMILPLLLPEHDHACIIYYPNTERNLNDTASVMLTSQLLSPLFFQQMRTEKQYGYLVGVGYIPINRYPGLAFYIQSPHTPAFSLRKAIDLFIQESLNCINETSEEDWQHIKQGLAGQLQEKDTSLRVKSQRFWLSICNEDHQFNRKDNLINAILATSLTTIKKYLTEQLSNYQKIDRITLISLKNEQEISNNSHLNNKIKNLSDFQQLKTI